MSGKICPVLGKNSESPVPRKHNIGGINRL
jgi:hypothetical protein